MSRPGGLLVALALAFMVFVLDQGVKRLVEGSIRLGESVQVVPGVLDLTHIKNTGGAFGILGGQEIVLLFGSAVAVVFVLWMLLAGTPGRLIASGCGLILGGAAGNLFDRLTEGEVTDYADLGFWPLQAWPIFNAADVAIVLGVGLLLISALWPERAGQPAS